ncbi:ElyC/SanA/YdcF family protein [Actinopolymorpha sp. NPDC004070]|uniref:ElyC/SanA/YdcF family protein n=1 Tax=Actinopolymorpha sp. NPDC004070 TaxID=3154548 RepID=UPI0033ABD9F6
MRRRSVAESINALVRFCARRDVEALTPGHLSGRADVAILFGGSILAGAAVFADAIRAEVAGFYLVVGGEGHSTDALRRQLRDRTGWPDVGTLTEAALFDRYLREYHGVVADALEEESTNCGNNVTNALALMDARGVGRDRIVLVQDATMQQRMDAGFRRHVPPTTELVNFASHQTRVREVDGALEYESAPDGMWEIERYVSLLMGEIPRLRDDADGYGPSGQDYISHVDVPHDVEAAFALLQESAEHTVRQADGRWKSQ